MVDIIHTIGVKAPLSMVYQGVATAEGVAGWWTRDTTTTVTLTVAKVAGGGAGPAGGGARLGEQGARGETLLRRVLAARETRP